MIFGVCLYCWLISCTFVNKQTSRIILSNHSPPTVARDKWYIVTWNPVVNLKLSAEWFEQRVKVKKIFNIHKSVTEEQINV